jgi:hypothetical protein
MKLLLIFIRAINPYMWYKAYRTWRAAKRSKTVSEFAHKHKELLVIVLDPVEDTMFLAHRDQQVLTKIKTADGRRHNIVRGVIKASQFKGNIDYLLAALIDGLQAPLKVPAVNQFIKWVDAAVYRVGLNLKARKEQKLERQKNATKV